MSTVTARARVTVTIEMPVEDTWGDDCDIAQVQKQAKDTAFGYLSASPKIGSMLQIGQAKIIGEMKVVAILVENKP